MTRIEIGTVVDFPDTLGYIAGTVVAMDEDYVYVTDGNQNRKYPHDVNLRPHRCGWNCSCED